MISNALTTYIANSSIITWIVLIWLSIYFIMSFTILFSRYAGLKVWGNKEQRALENILMGATIQSTNSVLKKISAFADKEKLKEELQIYISLAESRATSGLTPLSIVASTSPFIGLFGTVISILETFSKLSDGGGGINAIASSISEALVATACGIFVAIPAYSFNLMIKRRAYEILTIIKREASVILSR